ncbi:hypothetical protein ABFC64_08215 [Microbacterium rhizosphaerae]
MSTYALVTDWSSLRSGTDVLVRRKDGGDEFIGMVAGHTGSALVVHASASEAVGVVRVVRPDEWVVKLITP